MDAFDCLIGAVILFIAEAVFLVGMSAHEGIIVKRCERDGFFWVSEKKYICEVQK